MGPSGRVGERRAVLVTIVFALVVNGTGAGAGVTPEGVWLDGRTLGNFAIYAQFPLSEIEAVLDDLAQLPQDIEGALGIDTTGRPVTVLLFGSQGGYQQFLRREYHEVPYRRALYVERSGRALVLAYRSRELATDLRHEATHALLHSALPMIPLWLDEGLAEYFELPPGQRAFGHPYLKTVRFWCKLGYTPSLRQLEQIHRMEDMTANAYRWSWAWVHFFLHGPQVAREELAAYLATIQNYGVPGSLSERTERRLGPLKEAFLTHFRRWAE